MLTRRYPFLSVNNPRRNSFNINPTRRVLFCPLAFLPPCLRITDLGYKRPSIDSTSCVCLVFKQVMYRRGIPFRPGKCRCSRIFQLVGDGDHWHSRYEVPEYFLNYCGLGRNNCPSACFLIVGIPGTTLTGALGNLA